MRYPASEKLEIIRVVEQSHLSARKTLDKLGIPRRTFYRWYGRYLEGGPEALAVEAYWKAMDRYTNAHRRAQFSLLEGANCLI